MEGSWLHNIPSKEIHVLIPRNCECYLIWQKGFTDVIKLSILKWGDILELSKWILYEIKEVLVKGRQEG